MRAVALLYTRLLRPRSFYCAVAASATIYSILAVEAPSSGMGVFYVSKIMHL